MKQAGHQIYETLHTQYQSMGVSTNLIDPGLAFTIFNIKDLERPMPFSLPVSRLNFFVFGFVKRANGWYKIDERTFDLRPGTVYFTNPGHYRCFEYKELEEVHLITVSEAFLKENVHATVFEEFPFLLAETFPARIMDEAIFSEFEALYVLIHQAYKSSSPYRARIIGSLFTTLLLKLKEYFWQHYNAIQEGDRSSEIVKNFKRTLEKHYRDMASGLTDKTFRVQDYAAAQHLHPNYLASVIKSKTGKTVGAWITEKNIAEAKSLLQNSAISIKEIGYRLGFAAPGHFSNYFKKQTQQAPAFYRKEALASLS